MAKKELKTGHVFLMIPLYQYTVKIAFTVKAREALEDLVIIPSKEDANQEVIRWKDYREYYSPEEQQDFISDIRQARRKGRTTPPLGLTF